MNEKYDWRDESVWKVLEIIAVILILPIFVFWIFTIFWTEIYDFLCIFFNLQYC